MVQPPRGFGEKPVAIYHDPDLPPSHHYLAAYRWLRARSSPRTRSCTSASTATWSGCPARPRACRPPAPPTPRSATCRSIYPFLVNDPGEGTQAKRRAHATLVDHLVPPMARAETYGDIARLEQLLDEHAQIAALDPAKLPAIRAADLDADAGGASWTTTSGSTTGRTTPSSTTSLLHVDGWLCEIKDAQIRDGLHMLGRRAGGRGAGRPGAGHAARPPDVGRPGAGVPGLREALGLRRGVRRPGRRRRGRGPGPDAGRGDGGGRLGSAAVPGVVTATLDADAHRGRRRRGRRRAARSRRPRWCRGWRGTDRRDQPDAARARRRLRPGRAERLAAARPGQRAADRPQLLLRRSARGAVAARLGDRPGNGGLAARRATWPTPASYPRLGRPVGLGHHRDAHLRRRRGRGARAAGRAAGLGRGVPPRHRRSSRSRWPSWAARAST